MIPALFSKTKNAIDLELAAKDNYMVQNVWFTINWYSLLCNINITVFVTLAFSKILISHINIIKNYLLTCLR